MINEPIKITNLESLNREKERLRMYCSFHEELLSEKLHYLKSNPQELIEGMVLPDDKEQNNNVSGILDFVNENLLGNVLNLSGKSKLFGALIKGVEIGIGKLLGNFLKKS